MVRIFNRIAVCLLAVTALMTVPALAQQEAGDTEVGFSAIGFFTHREPVIGTATVIGSFGKYLTKNQYIGVNAGPNITFGSAGTSASGLAGLNFRQLFGSGNNKVWPFVGFTAGGFFSKGANSGQAGPEFGLKYYARQNVALEMSYQFNVQVGSGGGSVLDRSSSLVLFGFKYLF